MADTKERNKTLLDTESLKATEVMGGINLARVLTKGRKTFVSGNKNINVFF